MSKQVLDTPVSAQTMADLKVDSEIDRTKSITVRFIPGAQVFHLETGKTFIHLMKLSSYHEPYQLSMRLPTEGTVLSLLPSVLVLDEQFQIVARRDLDPANFQWAIGTTVEQNVTIDPKVARYALLYTKPADFGKEIKLTIDVGIAATTYRKLVSPIGEVTVTLSRKGCIVCELSPPK